MENQPGSNNPTTRFFRTEDLPLAAYLRLTAELRFHCIQATGNGHAIFVFLDPEGQGPTIEADFIAGKKRIDPLPFYNTQRLCLREAKRAAKGDRQ